VHIKYSSKNNRDEDRSEGLEEDRTKRTLRYVKSRGSERATNGELFEEDAKEHCVQKKNGRNFLNN